MEQTQFYAFVIEYLREIRDHLISRKPPRTFILHSYTLAAGANQRIDFEVIPDSYAIICDATSTAGAALAITEGEVIGGAAWITLAPGRMIRFPARLPHLFLTNPGTQIMTFTVIALGQDAFDYA